MRNLLQEEEEKVAGQKDEEDEQEEEEEEEDEQEEEEEEEEAGSGSGFVPVVELLQSSQSAHKTQPKKNRKTERNRGPPHFTTRKICVITVRERPSSAVRRVLKRQPRQTAGTEGVQPAGPSFAQRN